MLKEIKINNLAIIRDVEMEFNEKFSSLTGETGAGKSIILDGISLITGARANISSIRTGENKLKVTAVFEINDDLKQKIKSKFDDILEDENELIIYREIDNNSKSKININGKRVTLSTLSGIMENVIDIVGQFENQYLLNKAFHLELLDAFLPKNDDIKKIVDEIKVIDKKILQLEDNRRNTIEKKQIYEFNIKEIDELKLYEGIDEELESLYKIKFNSGRITENVGKTLALLDDTILKNLKQCYKNINLIADLSTEYSDCMKDFENCLNILSDISNTLNSKLEESDDDTDLDTIMYKINKISKLKIKYGDTISQILDYRNKIYKDINNLNSSSDEIIDLKNLRNEKYETYLNFCEKLTETRKEHAIILESRINSEFKDLNMKDAEFKISFEKKQGLFENGLDEVEFLIKTNKGQEYSKLSKIASGGEISRIMLALKIVFSKVDNLTTLIFDEIDAGISGQTVKMVAKKLNELSKEVQIICVTHSPNIAAFSKEQFLIYKSDENDKTITKIQKLDEEQRIIEIARIIAGENITEDLKNVVSKMISEGYSNE